MPKFNPLGNCGCSARFVFEKKSSEKFFCIGGSEAVPGSFGISRDCPIK